MTPYPPNLTASALYEIVKGVIPTAWPEGVRYEVGKSTDADGSDPMDNPMFIIDLDGIIPHEEDESQWDRDRAEEEQDEGDGAPYGCPMTVCVAAHAFNGAMAARVLGKGGVISPCSDIPHAAVSIGQFVWTAPTLLEALAAACREGK